MTTLLKSLLSQGYFAYIDVALAEKYGAAESQEALIAYLSLAVRNGHLCVQILNNVMPQPKILDSSEKGVSSYELNQLEKLIVEGSLNCLDPMIKEGHLFYFRRYWTKETTFIQNVQQLESSSPDFIFPQMEVANELLAEQADAIRLASKQCLTIICGGPGTGKTYTAGQMIRHFWQAMTSEQKSKCRIALAAPTGKAAANLQNSLNRAVGHLENFKPIIAKTLHALLEVKFDGTRKRDAPRYLAADIVIVDESSMIDVDMMTQLFARIKTGARLILLGDKYQLPSVEAGSLFADLMEARPMFSVELKQCMRSELQGILNLAKSVKEGNTERAINLLTSGEGITHLSIDKAQLLDYAFARFPQGKEDDFNDLLNSFNSFKVLSSLRQGALGADEFNSQLHKRALQKFQSGKFLVEPIILIGSDPNLKLFNGESGVLVKKGPDINVGDFALFPDRNTGEGKVRQIPALVLPKFDYAYCLSVHKSQGSEYEHVLYLMPEGTEFFGREVFYTAVTRARLQLEIWGEKAILEQTIQRSSKRYSGIQERLPPVSIKDCQYA